MSNVVQEYQWALPGFPRNVTLDESRFEYWSLFHPTDSRVMEQPGYLLTPKPRRADRGQLFPKRLGTKRFRNKLHEVPKILIYGLTARVLINDLQR